MKKIEEFICAIHDEIEGAKGYAEKYVINKNTNSSWARKYRDMAEQELAHAKNLCDIATSFAETLSWISEEDKEALHKAYAKRAECEAVVKLMLAS